MDSKKLIAVVRIACGTAIIITHMATGANSTFVVVGLALLGLPVEALQHGSLTENELAALESFKEVIAAAKASKEEN